jgi:hypothetical protein
MENKFCNKCGLDKPKSEYYKDKNKNDGLNTFCKICKKKSIRSSYDKNLDKRKKKSKEYREANKNKNSEYNKIYRETNKDKLKKYKLSYYETNKDIIKEHDKIYYENNKDRIMSNYFENRENRLVKMKTWKKNNRSKLAEYQRNYYVERRKTDPLFKLRCNISGLIRQSLQCKGIKKNSKTRQILGCDFQTFKEHLETKFEDWMSWENYGLYNGESNYGWDIDHITPSSLANSEEELVKLNHFTNLQPLCSYINRDVKIANH